MRAIAALFGAAFLASCGSTSGQQQPSTGGPPAQIYALTFTSAGDGTLTAAGTQCRASRCTATVAAGTTISITAVADAGATFAGFTGDCTGANCALTMNADHTVAGSFTRNAPSPAGKSRLTVHLDGNGSVKSNPAGIDCGAACAALFDTGTSVALSQSAAAGWHFTGWGTGCSGAGGCALALSADTEVWAKFEADAPAPPGTFGLSVTVTGPGSVKSTPAGIDCPGACSANFPSGTMVSLAAAPAANATFTQWSGACSGATSPCAVTAAAATQAGATFTANPPPPPDECAGLLPPMPGAPVVANMPPPGLATGCTENTVTDGQGSLLLGMRNGFDYGDDSYYSFTPSGVRKNFLDAGPQYQQLPFALDSGFQWLTSGNVCSLYNNPSKCSGFAAITQYASDGTKLWTQQIYQETGVGSGPVHEQAFSGAQLPGIGMVVAHVYMPNPGSPGFQLYAQQFDLNGSGAQSYAVDLDPNGVAPAFTVSGASRSGNVLVLWPDTNGGIAGRWLASTGAPVTAQFAVPGSLQGMQRSTLHRLLDGSLVLNVAGTWIARIPDATAGSTAPPAWLTGSMSIIRGAKAYALFSNPGTSCGPVHLTVVAPSGKSCGGYDLPQDASFCASSGGSGYDGTAWLNGYDKSVGGCARRWWTGLLAGN